MLTFCTQIRHLYELLMQSFPPLPLCTRCGGGFHLKIRIMTDSRDCRPQQATHQDNAAGPGTPSFRCWLAVNPRVQLKSFFILYKLSYMHDVCHVGMDCIRGINSEKLYLLCPTTHKIEMLPIQDKITSTHCPTCG